MCGVCGTGGLWGIVRRNIDHELFHRQHCDCRLQWHGEAGGDSGGEEHQRPQGQLDDFAVARNRRAIVHGFRRMERCPADERYDDDQSSDREHQLHTDLHRERRVRLAIGGGRRDHARPDDRS